MRNISELRDIELYELVDRSIKNMIHMGLINDDTVNVENVNIEEDYSFLNLNDYFDMDTLSSILFSRGYVPYWSSANSKNIYSREGKIVKYKNVAYILIRKEELTDNLKEQLCLDANVVFLSAVREYSDNGVYYGIWTEITSGMKCGEISELLAKEALKLPDLTDKKNSRKH